MAIPNVKRYRITNADGSDTATIMAVLPKGADVDAYLKDASQRFDWKAWTEMKSSHYKVRIGQQKQRKSK
jgi:proline dehydrogenase